MASRDKKKGAKAKLAPKAGGAKKSSNSKASTKAAPKKPAKATKAATAKSATKATAKSKPAAKAKVDDKRNGALKAAPAESKAKAEAPAQGEKKGPKGITIVQPKPVRKARPKPKFEMPKSEPLIKPGGKWKPLIPSGPKAPPVGGIGGQDQTQLPMEQRIKTKFTKRELEHYRQILLRKRAELVGDISNMEEEALRQSSGSLSHLPQHMAEQGTDTYDQGLSLDLAAVDRNLLREIDDALKRIDQGVYGICERTGNPIKPERLQEIPWARYSIEAAREMERRPYQE